MGPFLAVVLVGLGVIMGSITILVARTGCGAAVLFKTELLGSLLRSMAARSALYLYLKNDYDDISKSDRHQRRTEGRAPISSHDQTKHNTVIYLQIP